MKRQQKTRRHVLDAPRPGSGVMVWISTCTCGNQYKVYYGRKGIERIPLEIVDSTCPYLPRSKRE